MDRPADDKSLLDEILAAAKRVVVLRGAAVSGKTAAVIAMYQRFLDRAARPHCLLLAPNALATSDLRRRLLQASPTGVVISPQVLTFSALAGRVLAAVDDAGRMLRPFERRLLLRRIVDELNRAGRLSAFRSVADTPGLIVSLDRAIAELKRAAVEPDELARAVGRATGRSRDLLGVYRRYQKALVDDGVYDVEGRMWKAREVLRRGRGGSLPGLEGIEAVAVDGFTDFTPTQLEILQLFSSRFERTVITLPYAQDRRERMWRWTRRTLDRIRRTFGDDMAEVEAPPSDRPLRAVWRTVFDIDADIASKRSQAPDALEVLAAAGAESEVAAVARRIKRMLTEGAPAGSIAVLARSLDAYRPLIDRIFAEHDIPTAAAPQTLPTTPIVRFVLNVASLAPQFAFRDVLRTIANSYFRPQALGPYGPQEVAAAQMLIREGNVLAGRESYANAAERLGGRAKRIRDEDDDDAEMPLGAVRVSAELLRSAWGMLRALFELAEGAADAAGIVRLIDALELRQVACEGHSPRQIAGDLRALSELRSALDSVANTMPTVARIREALAAAACPPDRTESLVDVLDVLDARALRYRHVFLLGLSEGTFPRRFVESSLISEADRLAWARRGVELDRRGDLTAREMLLFYLAVSRADETLQVSFLDTDAEGRGAGAGAFLLALLEPFGGLERFEQGGRLRRIAPGGFIPPIDRIASRRDALNAAVAGLFDADLPGAESALGWAATHQRDVIRRASMGLFARARRYAPGECDNFDGRITDASLLKELARRFPAETVFSASRLNAYGQCPWQFFAAYVLKLKPLTEPQRQLEPVARGIFVHDVLFRVMRRLREEIGRPFHLGEVEREHLLKTVAEAVEAQASDVDARRPPYRMLWGIQRDKMHRELREYLLNQQEQTPAGTMHMHFELGFGVEGVAPELQDPASRAEPVAIDTPAGKVRIRGKIDRVDKVVGKGLEGVLVVDYKTGRLPSNADIDEGRNLQLPIYTEAAEQILAQPSVGGTFHQVAEGASRDFWAFKAPRGDDRTFDKRRGDAVALIAEFVRGMAAGRFDALPTHACPGYCPFRQICHYSPARVQIKQSGHAGTAP